MPQPTNSELFGVFDKVTRLELLPYPAVTYEEHLNTNFLLSLKRYSLLVEKVLGAVKVDGYDVIVNGSNIQVSAGTLFFKDFIVNESSDVVVDSFAAEDRKVILKITEVEYTYEANQSEVEEIVEGRSLSGPNQKRYTVEYLYQTGAVPSDTSTEFYLHLADIADDETVTKKVPSRDELLHELDTGESLLTDQNYKVLDTQVKNFFVNKKVDFGNGDETALFVDSKLIRIDNPAVLFRVESIESLSYNNDIDSSLDSKKSLFQNGLGTRVRVKFAWNYKTGVASGSNDTISLDNSGYSSLNAADSDFSIDQLVGYRVYFNSNWYYIVSNTATAAGVTTVTVEDEDGNTPDLSGVSGSATIENEANEYQIKARSSDGQTNTVVVQEREGGSESPVYTEATMEMDFGKKYEIEFSTFSILRYDQYVQTLNSGSITQWGTETLNYAASPDFVPSFADIPALPSVTLNEIDQDPYSLRLTIPGITPAEEDFPDAYEVIWNKESATAGEQEQLDFNGNYEHRVIVENPPSQKGVNKSVDIKHYIDPGELAEIRAKYRALIGMQVASSEGAVNITTAFNLLDAPQNLATEFLENGLYEQDSENDVYGETNFADRRNNAAAVKVTWDAVAKAKGYHIEVVALNASGDPVAGTTRERIVPLENGQTDTIGTDGVVLNYTVGRKLRIRVSALHLDSTRGNYSSVEFQEEVPRLSAPDFGTPTADDLGVVVPWTPVDGADHYEVYWSLTRNPQVSGSQVPADQESTLTRNTKIRINAPAGSDIFVGLVTIDNFGRRSLDMSRLQTQSGRVQDSPPMKTWTVFEKPYVNNYTITAENYDVMGAIRFTQPVRILGISVRPFTGEYFEAGTANSPADNELSDHPVKVRLYRSNEPSNNVSVQANGLDVENIVGTQTDVARDPLLTVSANTVLIIDYVNEHPTYDLANLKMQVDVFYRFEDRSGSSEDITNYRYDRSNI